MYLSLPETIVLVALIQEMKHKNSGTVGKDKLKVLGIKKLS